MAKRLFLLLGATLVSLSMLLILVCVLGRGSAGVSRSARAAALQITPTVTLVDPPSAANDLDASLVITGTDFEAGAGVWLGGTALNDVGRVSSTTLTATVPWGMDPGVYTLTVENPGGESGSLPNALTVTQGIGVWSAGALYGGDIDEVVINPVTPTTVYAADGQVGLFRSRDGGENWTFVYAPGARDVAIDPLTPTTIYWGTGGLFRSDDEGDTWHWLGDLVRRPYPHPTMPNTVYATDDPGYVGGSGLWKSTDRGQTWVTKTSGLTDTAVVGLVFHPTDPVTMYLGTADGNIFRSSDAGDSWSYVARPITTLMTLAINPHGAHELWVSNHCVNRPNLTLKSANVEHTTWITAGGSVGSESVESIAFPRPAWGDAFSETVFVAGCWTDNLFKTMNGGDTWEKLTDVRSG